jgi:hypothetical protein
MERERGVRTNRACSCERPRPSRRSPRRLPACWTRCSPGRGRRCRVASRSRPWRAAEAASSRGALLPSGLGTSPSRNGRDSRVNALRRWRRRRLVLPAVVTQSEIEPRARVAPLEFARVAREAPRWSPIRSQKGSNSGAHRVKGASPSGSPPPHATIPNSRLSQRSSHGFVHSASPGPGDRRRFAAKCERSGCAAASNEI